jgi:hypothetical protein
MERSGTERKAAAPETADGIPAAPDPHASAHPSPLWLMMLETPFPRQDDAGSGSERLARVCLAIYRILQTSGAPLRISTPTPQSTLVYDSR